MVSRRSLEILTGLLTGAFGAAVIVQSIEVGGGWSTGGVEAGTFPLIAGVLVCAGSLVNIGRSLGGENPTLIGRFELPRLAAFFGPALALIVAIPILGLYVASAGYLIGTLRLQHRLGWGRSIGIAGATVLVLYGLFERTFQILLPRGWLGSVFGY